MMIDDSMKIPELEVRSASFSLAHPWQPPPGVPTFALVDSSIGATARLRSDLSVFHDGECLFAIFSMDDDELCATLYERDSELWREDVVEVFLQPEVRDSYYEFEASPNGTLFDARVLFPGPTRETMSVDVRWNCAGFRAWVRRVFDRPGHTTLEVVMRIPFSCLTGMPPARGDSWRANFYRIDRSSQGDMFAAWSPTLTPKPDFHVPDRFGRLLFI